MAQASSVSKKPSYAVAYEPARHVKLKPLYYVAAFLIPALLTFISYVYFGVYPFGERSVLTLDLNGQYVYYFENIRRCFWEGESPLYSWARNLSGGYQGVIGYYLASPFTFIVILMPRKLILEALMIMQICKVGACGVTFCAYAQNSKGVRPLQSVIFSTMYALMAFVSIQLIDPMWIDGPIFLPLIMLGVEYLIDDGRKINYIIPLAIMFIANFYIGFMIAIFTALYFVYYMFFGAKRQFKKKTDYIVVFGRMVLATGVALMCSYIMIMPVYNALALGKFDFSEPDYSMKTMFNPIELLPTLFPNQYYSVNVDEGTRMYGRPEIYCGVLSFVLTPLYFFNKKISKNRKIGYGLMLFVMFFSMWIKPLNMMWHGGQDPNWLPYRYSFLVSFILVSMAAETFANLEGYKLDFKVPAGIFAVIAVLTFIFDALMKSFNYNEEDYKYVAVGPYSENVTINGEQTKHLFLGTLVFGVILSAIYLTFAYIISHSKTQKQRNVISIFLAAFVFFEAGYNMFDTVYKIDKEVYYSSKKSYSEIMSAPNVKAALDKVDDSFYRAEKTFFRNVNDNQAYGLRGISHSSSVMNARILKFIETLGYTTKSYETRYDGNTPLADSLLGIKYVLDDPDNYDPESNAKTLLSPYYKKVASTTYQKEDGEHKLDIYENPDALPIAFMADDDILRLSFLGNDNPFNSMNNFLSSMTGNTPDYSNLQPKEYFYRHVFDPSKDVELSECTTKDYNGQYCYDAMPGAVDPTVRVHLTSQSEDNLYMFLKSDNPKKCNLWLSTTKDPETGEFKDFKSFGSYYEGYDYAIVNLGSFPVGTEIELRMTILQQDKTGANEYIMVKDYQLYYFDYDAFHEDIQQLKQNPLTLDMDKTTESRIVGEVDAQAGQILYTSIPYEPGWTIKVDGQRMEEQFEDVINDAGTSIMTNYTDGGIGSVVILNAMIGLRLSEGHHTIEMTYSPPGFKSGVLLLLLGICAIAVFWWYDRKNNPAIIQKLTARANRKNGISEEPEADSDDKKSSGVKIIKSKGAVAEKELSEIQPEKQSPQADVSPDKKKNKSSKNSGETAVFSDKELSEVSINETKPAPKHKNNNGGKKKKKKK
ncbi:MAG: YfhO family protein [Ruminococcus sp.]|nr:YfhO family protein [Ruminococcus sp.]